VKLKEFRKKTWPYGFKMWLWSLGLRHREKGLFKSDLGPNECFELLDPESWMPHFMEGRSPLQSLELDIKEGGENV